MSVMMLAYPAGPWDTKTIVCAKFPLGAIRKLEEAIDERSQAS